jgi:RNA polymerase sigma factor (sigma-70 family)
MMNDDLALVRDFAASQSEPAFATLVVRHIALVHSVALRQAGDPHLAHDVTQAVFIILAHKAGSLGPDTIVSAWLYRTACYVATETRRNRRRREQREQEAYMQSTLKDPQAGAWEHLSPLLDEAMAGLSEPDRAALVLRFFEDKTASEIAAALRVNEDAAQKRVTRALDKLRIVFRKHGVISTTAIIAGAISANSVQAAPPAMAKLISTVAMTKGAVAGSSTLTLVKGALRYMAWKKAQSAITVAMTVLLLGGGATIATLARTKATPGQSTGRITSRVTGGTGTGRQVTVAGDISVGLTSGGGASTVRLGDRGVDAVGKIIPDHTVIVETGQALLDGEVWTRIPASAMAVDIVYTNQTLSIAADKKLLFAAKLNQ